MTELLRQRNYKTGKDLYNLLPEKYRSRDHSEIVPTGETEKMGIHLRFMRTFGDLIDDLKESVSGIMEYLFSRECPEEALGHLAANMGWPLDGRTDADTARLLIDNLRHIYGHSGTEYLIRFLAYVLTGTDVNVIDASTRAFATLDSSYLQSGYEPENGYIHVNDSSVFSTNDRITVFDGSRFATTTVGAILGNYVYINRDLSYMFRSGSQVFVGEIGELEYTTGVFGFVGLISDYDYSDTQRTDGNLTIDEEEELYSILIEWHHVPNLTVIETVTNIIEYFIPARFRVSHVYRDYTGFMSDLNISDGVTRTDTA